jgi:arylsulfatase
LDIFPVLSGKQHSVKRDPLLYFNLYNLQCARLGNWKLHVARYNTAPYVPAPPNGVHNYLLPKPELYDLAKDPDESYDVAPQHPEIVRQMLSSIDRMILTFPEPVKQAWQEARSRKVNPETPTGAWPRPL